MMAAALGAQWQESIRRAVLTPGLQSAIANVLRTQNQLAFQIDPSIFRTIRATAISNQLKAFDTLRLERLLVSSLTSPRTYQNPDPPRSPYSSRMTKTADYFANDEVQ